ncbi:thiol reductant ABC exporter subunit CydC [Martelella mediterranea]|uniref:Putative ABC transporter ATP-binding protein n=1 Tax=Martelella mediterranea DSM 17316 TaxID=1122214 RepID=A0A1U9YYY8_9HYPH|nr:thiol reductant ABC exporter subunit CydC [Martelella mediterranea]AQZ50572.1 putative ABC transporter ATP-binding protein [Martelella mediterranea DSM 17316]
MRTRGFAALGPIIRLFWRERRGGLVAGAALSAFTVLAGIALLGVSGWFVTATAIAGLSMATALAFDVFAPSAAIRFLALSRTAGRYFERLQTHDATLRVLAGLRVNLFRGFAAPGAARALALRPARLLFRLTADVDALDSLYLRVLVPGAVAVVAGLAAIIALGILSWPLALAVGAAIVLPGLALPALAARAAEKPARRRAHTQEALRARAVDMVAGQSELALAGRLDAQRERVENADRREYAADLALNRIDSNTGFGFDMVTALILAGVLLAGAALAEAGQITAPLAALALLIAFAALEPFAALRRGAMELGRTLLAARRLSPRLEAEPAASAVHAAPDAGIAMAFDNVRLRYPGRGGAAISGLTLTIAEGERVALIGASGAGKSSIMALIAGEVAPDAGTIAALPATLLTQRTELFQDTLRANLKLAFPAAGDERLMEALDAAGLGDTVRGLPHGLDTELGEQGLGLSGGQARRLALARLVLRDTPVWLLDEPSEGLDGKTARDVMTKIKARAGKHRSLLIATHIRREAEIADRLIMINSGRIVSAYRRGEPGFAGALAALRPD